MCFTLVMRPAREQPGADRQHRAEGGAVTVAGGAESCVIADCTGRNPNVFGLAVT